MTSHQNSFPMLERAESSPAGVIPDAIAEARPIHQNNRQEDPKTEASEAFSIADDHQLLELVQRE